MEGGRRWENEAVEGRKCERMCLRREIKYTERANKKDISSFQCVYYHRQIYPSAQI